MARFRLILSVWACFIALLLACNLLASSPEPPSGMVAAQVVKVVDGDTITVRLNGQELRVRYILVDTPETKHPSRPVEPFGPEAAAANEELVGGKTVFLEKDVSETDQHGRLLRYVYVDDLMVNEELLRQGLARVSTFPPDVKYVDRFLEVQAEAQAAGVGIWGSIDPGADGVIISEIFYDGHVREVESDEYIEIKNTGETTVNLQGWQIRVGRGGSTFNFPNINLSPNQSCRVYTNEIHPETCGLSFNSERTVWRNKGDCGYLYNADDVIVAQSCY